ncbi:MAG TPA: hypothetical protein DIC64_00145 [Alphaproteobacteria bacterium]|nr:hypothetical protein [Alphaproteobacteria bacterium]
MDEEYIKTLSEEEKIVFLKLFCVLIKSDNEIDQDEISFLKMISAKYGVPETTIVEIIKSANSIDAVREAEKIKDRLHALELVKELCFLANVDDSLHENELGTIINISRAMHVEDEKLILINRFVLDSLILYKAGRVILEKENG